MIAVLLAEGFEEIEALAVVDILRRARLETVMAGVEGSTVCGSHGIAVMADLTIDRLEEDKLQAVILPGGLPGTTNLEKSPAVRRLLESAASRGLWIGAICAAPSLLGHLGLLRGRKAVCFPGYEADLEGAQPVDRPVVTDGNIITAKGAGAAIDFGLELAARLASPVVAEQLRKSMQCR